MAIYPLSSLNNFLDLSEIINIYYLIDLHKKRVTSLGNSLWCFTNRDPLIIFLI